MNITKSIVVGLATAIAVFSWMQTSGSKAVAGAGAQGDSSATLPTGTQAINQVGHGQAASMARTQGNGQAGQPFPFVAGVADANSGSNKQPGAQASAPLPEPEIVSPEEAARRKKMEKLGYMVPPDYYTKNLDSLRQLAQRGDAFALVHLGEKYYFELNGQRSNPEFDPAMNYPDAAKKSFSEALAVGNIRSAGIISEIYLQENNAVDAYAWHLLSKQLGDSISAEWFEKTKLFASLSEQQKQQAQAKIPTLINNINDLSSRYKVKSPF
jgi:hypothetical protein